MNQEDNRTNLKKGIEEFLSHYPPFLRHLVFPGVCSLVMVAAVILLAVVGSCMNCAGACAYMGKRLAHRDTECIIGLKCASGYLGSTGGGCFWDISVETKCMEMRFECEEAAADYNVIIMSGDGSMVIREYTLKETKSAFLVGPAEYRVIIFAENGFGPWSAEWD